MNKNIIIIGAGISGLSCLHYLKEKYKARSDVKIVLLEKNNETGGTVKTEYKDGCYFEYGPNGFLDHKEQTFKLIEDLGLNDQVITATEAVRTRFISLNGRLYAVPTDQTSFMQSKLFGPLDRLRIGLEPRIPKGLDRYESLYHFARRRAGTRLADVLVDPMASGIYAGDAKTIVLRAAFPKVWELEQEHGSIMKALKYAKAKDPNASLFPKPKLMSFKKGMGQLIDALSKKYQDSIHCNCEVRIIKNTEEGYVVETKNSTLMADYIILAVPSYAACAIVSLVHPEMADQLLKINYAPLAVVGLVYKKDQIKDMPQGFGYLIPSKEKDEVLGVLFENNIFSERSSGDQMIFRVMMGGAHHPQVIEKSKEALIKIADANIKRHISIKGEAHQAYAYTLPQAIPQYDVYLVKTNEWVEENCKSIPLKLAANWYHGVSFNDCIENAYKTVQSVTV